MPAQSRRNFLRNLGIGAAAGAALQFAPEFAYGFEPQRAATSVGSGGPILLNSNENAYGPSANVSAALQQALAKANRYPDFHYEEFISRVAALHKVPREQVVTGCGSTEVLRMCAAGFLGADKKLVTASPTFEALGHYARGLDAQVVTLPLTTQYAHDVDAMAAAADAHCTLVYVCNPNNPTGSITPRAQIEALVRRLPK